MLYSLFQAAAARAPERIAIWHNSRSISYHALDARIRSVSARLNELGVARGTKVATCVDSRPETLVLYYAIARLGAQLISLDTNSTRAELEQVLLRCSPALVVAEGRYREDLRAALASLPEPAMLISEGSEPHSLADLFREGPSPSVEAKRAPEVGPFHITFTSGSTGRPKGIVVSQRALCQRIGAWIARAELSAADEHLCALTLSHAVGPQYAAFPALSSGGSVHLMDPLMITPQRVLRYLSERRITHFAALPYFYQLMTTVPNVEAFDLSALRVAMSVAAPLPEETARAFFAKFGVTLNNGYGLSESGIVIADLTQRTAPRDATIGTPQPGVEIRLLSDGSSPSRSDAAEGEIAVRSQTLADRYFSDDDGPLLRDGWLHTGDVARRDSEGRYHIVGRLSQFINVAGSKAMPLEIEQVIAQIDGVREVAVIGVPDPRTTQKVAAFVVGDVELSAERVLQHCREKLAAFKVPAYVEFLSELPKSSLGKILKTQLRSNSERG